VSKYKIKNNASSNEELISEMQWNFPCVYIYNLNDMIVVNFILGSPFHI
jgi:hypothetical protein